MSTQANIAGHEFTSSLNSCAGPINTNNSSHNAFSPYKQNAKNYHIFIFGIISKYLYLCSVNATWCVS